MRIHYKKKRPGSTPEKQKRQMTKNKRKRKKQEQEKGKPKNEFIMLKKSDSGWFPIITAKVSRDLCSLKDTSFGIHPYKVDRGNSSKNCIYFDVSLDPKAKGARRNYNERFAYYPKEKRLDRVTTKIF